MRSFSGHFYGPRMFYGGLSFLLLLAIVGLLIYVVMLLRRDGQTPRSVTPPEPAQSSPPPAATPGEIIRMRYARGEITREDYETMRRDLE